MNSYGRTKRPVSKPKIPPLDQRIKPNPKYSKVRPTIDTGYNLRKQMERLERLQNLYKFRADEIFRRINVTTFVTLMLEVSKLKIQEADEEDRSLSGDSAIGGDGEDMLVANDNLDFLKPPLSSGRISSAFRSSSVADLVQGIGEMDLWESVSEADRGQESSEPPNDGPYLLLDVRSEEEYDREHIVGAQYFPVCRLNSINFETKQMLKFKNKEGKIIVLYDFDESIAPKCATVLIQRGYDNVFLLSGGIRVAKMRFPERLCQSGKSNDLSEQDISILDEQLLELLNSAAESYSRLRSSSSSRMSGGSRASSKVTNNGPLPSRYDLSQLEIKRRKMLRNSEEIADFNDIASSVAGSNSGMLRKRLSSSQPSLVKLSDQNSVFVRQLRR